MKYHTRTPPCSYESLRASQDKFTKIENMTKNDNFVAEICIDKLTESEMVSERVKRRRGEVVVCSQHVSWHDALIVVGEVIHQVKPEEIVRVAGNGKNTNAYLLSGYLLNSSIQGLEKADCFLLVSTQPRVEATMVNAIIRKTVRASQAKTVEDVSAYYEALVCKVFKIESGRVELPSYADDVDKEEDDGEKNVVVKNKRGRNRWLVRMVSRQRVRRMRKGRKGLHGARKNTYKRSKNSSSQLFIMILGIEEFE
ncbi:NADH dehydrogenase [ubiquinone] iron-sulfur protein 1, mitochondrial [Tanacetum coccineum]